MGFGIIRFFSHDNPIVVEMFSKRRLIQMFPLFAHLFNQKNKYLPAFCTSLPKKKILHMKRTSPHPSDCSTNMHISDWKLSLPKSFWQYGLKYWLFGRRLCGDYVVERTSRGEEASMLHVLSRRHGYIFSQNRGNLLPLENQIRFTFLFD